MPRCNVNFKPLHLFLGSNCSSNACAQVGIRCLSDTSCCHKDCIGGCTGPTAKDCVACRKYINVNLCVPECPPEYIEDITSQKPKRNPNFRYASGLFCRRECQSKTCFRKITVTLLVIHVLYMCNIGVRSPETIFAWIYVRKLLRSTSRI